jgi:urease accessory protein
MLIVNKLIPQGRGLAKVLLNRAPSVELDWDRRCKSRFDAVDSNGRVLGVFLPRGTVIRGGDVLVAEDGSLVAVKAAPQPVLVVRQCPDHGAPRDLLRAAYHLGNRHVAIELQVDRLQIEPDPVLASMLKRMHLDVTESRSPFEPEAGAYQDEPTTSHGHTHSGHGYPHAEEVGRAHDHDHDHGHGQGHGHSHGHVHGHEIEHDRGHHADADHGHGHGPDRGPGLDHGH